MVITTEREKPKSLYEDIAKLRSNEFKALYKIINDIGVELRLLVALANKEGQNRISEDAILELCNRYEDAALALLRDTVLKLRMM